ncbi:MAG: MBL fold metallo-hydrolase [Candidatus Thermoplasmatota archaeon]
MTWTGRFLGAAEDIGRLGFVLESAGSTFLFDYGMEPDKPPQYPLPAPPIDRVFLTHAHLDHSGMIPWLTARYDASIMTTPVTQEVATLMHRDSLKIARSEGFPEPYGDADIEAAVKQTEHMDFKHPKQMGMHSLRLHSAGHIPGAAQMELKGPNGTLVFTGDLYTKPQRVVMAATQTKADVLFMESTYAGREHPPRDEVEKEFREFCHAVKARGGITIAAAFAVGRAQELAMVLAGEGLNVWMDGMARTVAGIFMQHPQYLNNFGAYQRAMGGVKMVRNHRGRSTALDEADVIITTGGMLDGGPILFYLDAIRNDPKCGVALTGYQVEGTNGRKLFDEGMIDFDTREPGKSIHRVHCEVRKFDFSAHAGHKDLVDFAKKTGAKDIVLFHGDQREKLVGDLSDFATVHLPMRDQTFTIK